MTYEQMINMACAKQGISQAELARRLGVSPQGFNAKTKRETFTPKEMADIATALGASYEYAFVFPDGSRV